MVITVVSVGVLDVAHSLLNYDSVIFAAVVLSVFVEKTVGRVSLRLS